MSHYNCPAYGSLRTYPAYQQPRCWSIIECPSGNHIFAINSYDTLKLKTFDNRISISGNACEKTITFDLNTDVSFNNIDVDGDALITGKLTVGGLIDPTGLVLEHQAAAPHTNTGTQGTLWVNGNDLKFTDSTAATITLGAGGGDGGGGVDSKWKERTFASSKWLEPSGTDISGIICGNVLIEEFLLVEKKFFAGGPMESPLLQVLPVSEGTPNGSVVVVGPLNCGPLSCENLWCEENLDVSGNLTVEGSQVDVCGNLTVSGNLAFNGQVEGGLRIEGGSTNDVYIEEDLDVSGNVRIAGDVHIKEVLWCENTLDVSGNVRIAGDVHIEQVLWCENTLDVSGNLTVEGSQVDVCGNLAVSGNLAFNGQVEGGLRIEGGSTNDVYIEEDLDVSGNVRIAGDVHIEEVLWCENTLDVSGNLTVEGSQVDVCGNLAVGGNIKCESLDVSGGRIRYSVGNNWVHDGIGTNDIPSTHAVVQVSGGSVNVPELCDIDNTSAVPGQILTIVVPASKELSFSGASNVVQPGQGGGVIAKGGTSVQFVFLADKWYPLGLYPS